MGMSKEGGFVKSWKRRWLVLFQDGTIEYYTNQTQKTQKSSGKNLTKAGIQNLTKLEDQRTLTFTHDSSGTRVWQFKFQNTVDADLWLKALSPPNQATADAPLFRRRRS